MNFIEDTIHPNLHWLILFVAILAIVRSVMGWMGSRKFQDVDDVLMAVFTALIGWQVVFGLILLLWNGLVQGYSFSPYDIRHGIVMLLAAFFPPFFLIWRQADDRIRSRNNLLIILISLVLIKSGISIIRSIPIIL